jgi:hypothetical protein
MKYFTKGWLKGGVSDGWGFAFEFYPREKSLTIVFIHWYIIIERGQNVTKVKNNS